jgi:hypothetical protein
MLMFRLPAMKADDCLRVMTGFYRPGLQPAICKRKTFAEAIAGGG